MSKRTRKSQKTRTPKRASAANGLPGQAGLNQELIVVATAETMEEAKEYETLLKNNDIPAMVRQRPNEFGEGKRYAVIAPEDMADEAHVIIESQDAYDDFYDSGLDEETEEDFEGDIFEDGS